ncbi:MAG: transcriptional regulator, partial [Actinomycetota bacterium]
AVRAADRKQIDHPEVGLLTLDCDVLTVQGADLRVVTYTAEPGSGDADKLALLRVLGLQAMPG